MFMFPGAVTNSSVILSNEPPRDWLYKITNPVRCDDQKRVLIWTILKFV